MSIDLQVENAIATVTINNPQELNAMDLDHLGQLASTFEDLGKRTDVRVILLTGAGDRAFAAGANIKNMSVMTQADALEFGRAGHHVCRTIELTPQPVIAVIRGFALGGGCEIAMACDFRLCDTTAVIGQPEVALGIPAGWGGTQRMTRLIGKGAASEMLFSGHRASAEHARDIGLVNSVHEPSVLMENALKLAGIISRNSPTAVSLTKQLIATTETMTVEDGLRHEAETFASVFESHDQREGMNAFVEKRKPVFEDREG